MSNAPEYLEKFAEFLQETNWNKHLVSIISRFLETKRFTITDTDSLLMSATKKVETCLKTALVRHQGGSIPTNRSYGMRLLDYAVDCHFIPSRGHSNYALFSWILQIPRNSSHHSFTSYPYNTLVMFMTEANHALEELDRLQKPLYGSYLKMNYDKAQKKIKIEKAQVIKPDGSALPQDQKVEVSFHFPNNKIKTTPLTPIGSGWIGEYDVRGENCGTVSCYLRGVNGGSGFIGSGFSMPIGFPRNECCPKCGTLIVDDDIYFCPSCGERLHIL